MLMVHFLNYYYYFTFYQIVLLNVQCGVTNANSTTLQSHIQIFIG